ncbi:DUF72 domain-containing protein [Sphingobacterium sp. LRF_L2]|uniref:DUF72 domain-containing protein n=1 Tax=Sphingobacterium sp. LRF_L2 TaxID=3369421 RepID=UPI003F5FB6F1
MKFGQVENPEEVDFTLPPIHEDTLNLLHANNYKGDLEVYVGCAKWNKTDLRGFYPPGVKDELPYYSKQFNAIELNTTFYNSPSKKQVEIWKDKSEKDFKFFPKIPQSISHYSRLQNVTEKVEAFVDATVLFQEKLGMAFLQMHDYYKPKDFDRLSSFLTEFPKGYPLAIELRNTEWFSDTDTKNKLYKLLEDTEKTNVLVDTAGRRDLLHMRLTTPVAFIRYVGANIPSDYDRLTKWIAVIKQLKDAGLEKLYFFIHQNTEEESPLLATHFITLLNREIGTTLHIPKKEQSTLF